MTDAMRAVVYHAPGDVRAEHAALAEPLSCTVNAAENCGLRPGRRRRHRGRARCRAGAASGKVL